VFWYRSGVHVARGEFDRWDLHTTACLILLPVMELAGKAPKKILSKSHSSIMFRLLYGASIDTLKLARNARTSPEMIDRFYAAPLMGEMAIQKLQAKRRPRPRER
jgi:hypothetical protein